MPKSPGVSNECDRARAVAVVRLIAGEFALSTREVEVLGAAAWGRSTKETAADLRLSAKTVEYYWKKILEKFSRRSRLEVMSLLFLRAFALQAPALSGSEPAPGISRVVGSAMSR